MTISVGGLSALFTLIFNFVFTPQHLFLTALIITLTGDRNVDKNQKPKKKTNTLIIRKKADKI